MGGWNSGTFDETSPVGKDWVNFECGMTRVFVKAGRRAGKATLSWRYEGELGSTFAMATADNPGNG